MRPSRLRGARGTARVAGRGLTLAILLVVFALNFMDRQILAVLAEPIKRDLALSDTQVGLLYGLAFAVFYTALGIPLARLADRFDRARIITWSLAVFSLMTALCGAAASYWQLLLARVGVGVGEAGTNPPSHSMIADLYPVDRRSTAMAIFALGPCLGVLLGFLVGGWLGQILGWRAAFLVAGLVGLAFAAAAHLLLKDPGRVDAQGIAEQPHALPGPRAVWRTLWRHASTRHLFMGAAVCSIAGYAAIGWLPAFLIRSHGMSVSAAGTALALTIGIVGGAGTLLGGLLADRIGKRNAAWRLRIVAIASLAAIPAWLAMLFAAGSAATLALLVPCGALLAFYLGPTFAMVQSLVDPRMRAVAAALLLLVMNLIGLGLGPVAGRVPERCPARRAWRRFTAARPARRAAGVLVVGLSLRGGRADDLGRSSECGGGNPGSGGGVKSELRIATGAGASSACGSVA